MCGGFFRTTVAPSATILFAPGCSRSCMQSAFGANVAQQHPWLPASVYKAFAQAKRMADADLEETTALKVGLPWVAAELHATREVMGRDFWPYGVEANRKTLSTMARYSYEQGLMVRLLPVEEMFAESTLTETRV